MHSVSIRHIGPKMGVLGGNSKILIETQKLKLYKKIKPSQNNIIMYYNRVYIVLFCVHSLEVFFARRNLFKRFVKLQGGGVKEKFRIKSINAEMPEFV